MVFKPQTELKKPKYDKIKIWEDGWERIQVAPPPANNSTQTLDDIKKIQMELKRATETVKQQYLNCDEDSSYYIKKYMEDNDLEYDNDNIEFMEKQCSPVIRHFKNFFNRPRPYQIADKLGMKFDPYVTPTAQTPSYPSGHAVQPRVVAHYYVKNILNIVKDCIEVHTYVVGVEYKQVYIILLITLQEYKSQTI